MNKIEKLKEINKQLQEICANIETELFIKDERIEFNQKIEVDDKTIKK